MPILMTRRRVVLATTLATSFALSLSATPIGAQETRILETTFGSVEIPVDPTRIVTTHPVATHPLVDLGVIPVGRDGYQGEDYPLWELIADVPVVATGERNIEAIAALEPDLILEVNGADDDLVARLREIAPVVLVGVTGPDRTDWRNRARQIADAVGALDRWQALEDELEARQAEIAARYGDFLAENPIAIWSIWTPGSPALYGSQSMSGPVLTAAGAVFAEGIEAVPYEGYEPQISIEDVPNVLGDARILFYPSDWAGNVADLVEETRNTEIHQRLPAVVEGREFAIGTQAVSSYLSAHFLLDQFEAAIAMLAAEG